MDKSEIIGVLADWNFWRGDKEIGIIGMGYSGREVDFVVKEGLNVKNLIQVCWDLGDENIRKREIRVLLRAMRVFDVGEGLVLTEDFEGVEEFGGGRVIYRPLWKWFLQD